jgi:hypothetical protein
MTNVASQICSISSYGKEKLYTQTMIENLNIKLKNIKINILKSKYAA